MEASKKEIVIKKANDHWAFLEHIEAPTWADLTLEAKSCSEDIIDDWFNVSHPFHQWSARTLKSKFSHPGEEIITSEVDYQGPLSSELPSSVSRSRRKDYKTKKWKGANLNSLLNKQHTAKGLTRTLFQKDINFGQEVKLKSNVIRPKGMSSAKLGLDFKHNASGKALSKSTKPLAPSRNQVTSSSSLSNKTGKINRGSTITCDNAQKQKKFMEVSSQPCDQKNQPLSFRSISLGKSHATEEASRVEVNDDSSQSKGHKSSSGKSHVQPCVKTGYPATSSSPVYNKTSESNTRSTITFENNQQHRKFLEVSSQPYDQKIGPLSFSGINLRKSCVTKEASRVEIDVDSRPLRARKSSSGKSSVGSCSNPSYEVKVASKPKREKFTDNKDVARMILAADNRCKPSNISRTSILQVERARSSKIRGSKVRVAKPAQPNAAKPMVQCQNIHSTALRAGRVSKQNLSSDAKEKLRTSKVNNLAGKGKENSVRSVAVHQECSERVAPAGALVKVQTQNTTGQNLRQNDNGARSAFLKMLGQVNDQCEPKIPTSLYRRIYLR